MTAPLPDCLPLHPLIGLAVEDCPGRHCACVVQNGGRRVPLAEVVGLTVEERRALPPKPAAPTPESVAAALGVVRCWDADGVSVRMVAVAIRAHGEQVRQEAVAACAQVRREALEEAREICLTAFPRFGSDPDRYAMERGALECANRLTVLLSTL